MKNLCLMFMAIILAFSIPLIANAQVPDFNSYLEFNTIGGGARAAGMGGAFLGLSEGEYGFSWNPGALTLAEKRHIGLQFTSVADKHTEFFNNQMVEINKERFKMDFGGFSVPFSFMDRQWAVGGGYRNIFNLKSEFEYQGENGGKGVSTQSDGVDAIGLAVSGKIVEGIGFGFNMNTYVRGTEGNTWEEKAFIFEDPDTNIPDTFDVHVNRTSHFSGVNFDIGLAASFSMFDLGAVLHTPFDLTQEDKLTSTVMFRPQPVGTIDRITYTTSMPLGLSFGVAAVPITNLTLAVDVDHRPMGDVEIEENWESLYYEDSVIDPQWENLTQFRVGAEYMLSTGFANIPLRAGFRNNPSVAKELTTAGNNPVYGDQINTNILSFGSGLHFEKAWIDAAYQFGSGSNPIRFGSTNSEVKHDLSRLYLSAGMYF